MERVKRHICPNLIPAFYCCIIKSNTKVEMFLQSHWPVFKQGAATQQLYPHTVGH